MRQIETPHQIMERLEEERRIRCIRTHADSEKVIAWIKNQNRKDARAAFTAGPERQIAYAVEGLILDKFLKEKRRNPMTPETEKRGEKVLAVCSCGENSGFEGYSISSAREFIEGSKERGHRATLYKLVKINPSPSRKRGGG